MQMISLVFFAFLAAVFAALRLCLRFARGSRAQAKGCRQILLAASYLFIAWADVRFALCILLLTLAVWFCARRPGRTVWGVAAALASLIYFKYAGFFLDSFCALFGLDRPGTLQLIVPLGLSYYSFSAISYLMDVRRQRIDPAPLADVALYLAYFPKLTSGPIQRCGDFLAQLSQPLDVGWSSFSRGLQIFCFGLFKKLVLADRLSVFVNQVFDVPAAFSGGTVLLAVLSYSLQIYFDFSGYSDMAIGASAVLGVRLPANFNLPYLSRSVRQFWKRWHISLSEWLQDYLYISLGGSRCSRTRTCINLLLTMLLGGLWHGASWNYVLWGFLHGAALVVHRLWTARRGPRSGPVRNALSTAATFLFVSFCWIFFRAETLTGALSVLGQILFMRSGVCQPYLWTFVALAILILGSAAAILRARRAAPANASGPADGFYPLLDLTKFWHLTLFFVFCGLIISLAHTGGSPFIYGAY